MKMRIDFRDVPFTANNRRMLRYTYKHLVAGGMKPKTARKEIEVIYMIWLRSIAWQGAEADPNSEHYVEMSDLEQLRNTVHEFLPGGMAGCCSLCGYAPWANSHTLHEVQS